MSKEPSPLTKIEVSLELDHDQFDKFTDFLAWLKEDRETKSDGKCHCDFPNFTFDSPMACENCGGGQ